MFEQTTRVLSENLARAVNRRTFLKRASQGTFAVMATIAAGHSLSNRASAMAKSPGTDPLVNPQCSPPGPYCNLDGVNNPNGCHGAHCFQHRSNNQVLQCQVYSQYYQAGCWTTAVSGGYWTCCDCACGPSGGAPHCGCAQFSAGPIPLPDGPGATRD
jgi:hypothetical protein